MKEIEEKDYLVRKHNYLVNSVSSEVYSPNELKLISTIISLVDKDDTNFKDKILYMRDLDFINSNTCNYTYYKKIFENLRKKTIRLPNGVETNWISKILVQDGFIKFSIDDRLNEYLLETVGNSKHYYISNVLALNTSYNIHIYELLNQFRGIGSRTMSIEDFKDILNIPKSYNATNIKKAILDKAIIDLKENTDIEFSYKSLRKGAKFDKILFTIKASKHSKSQKVQNIEEQTKINVEEQTKINIEEKPKSKFERSIYKDDIEQILYELAYDYKGFEYVCLDSLVEILEKKHKRKA